MKLKTIIDKLALSVRCGENNLDQEATGGFASDLLSNAIADCKKGDIWITVQIHANIVAVAVLKELSAVIIVQGREPADELIRKAKEENVTILVSGLTAYETAGKLYQLGVGVSPS